MPDLSPSLFAKIHTLPTDVKGIIWKESNVPLATMKSEDKFVRKPKEVVSDLRESRAKEKITQAEHDNAALEMVKASAGTPHEVDALSEYLKSAQKDPSLLRFEDIQHHSLFTQERVGEWTPEFTESAAGLRDFIPADKKKELEKLITQSPQITKQLKKQCQTETLDWNNAQHQKAMIELMPDMLPKTQKFAADEIEKTQVHQDAVAEFNKRPNAKMANDSELFQTLQSPDYDKEKVFRLIRSDRNYEYTNHQFQAATLRGNTDAVQYLSKHGADVNLTDEKSGNTLFLNAIGANELPTARALAEAGANVKTPNRAEQSAMHIIANQGNVKAVPIFHELGVPIDTVNKDGMTPLHLAAESNSAETARSLIGHGADINKKVDGQTALDIALEAHQYSNRDAVINTLKELGAKRGNEIP